MADTLYNDTVENEDWIKTVHFRVNKAIIRRKGGPGSGHHGHAGRPGQVGGSLPEGGMAPGSAPEADTWYDYEDDPRAEAVMDAAIRDVIGEPKNWEDVSERDRQWMKEYVSKELQKLGIHERYADRLLGVWAATSNDDNISALQLQYAASQEFGVELSEWQQVKLSMMMDHYDWDVDAFNKARQQFGDDRSIGDSLEHRKDIARKVYENTQAYLASQGFKPDDTITLYRGFEADANTPIGEARGDGVGEVYKWDGNVLESWSIGKYVAQVFAGSVMGGAVLAMNVPISSIWSTAVTGPGCLNEGEFIVFGNLGSTVKLIQWKEFIFPEGSPE